MTPRKQRQQTKADLAEIYVEDMARRMGCDYTRADGKHPYIDGYIQMNDGVLGVLHLIAVQVKSGESNVLRSKRRFLFINAKPQHILKWQRSTTPVILVWVDLVDDRAKTYALWGDPRRGKAGRSAISINKRSFFDGRAYQKLLELARDRPVPRIHKLPLRPSTLRDVKQQAWEFYSNWRREGSISPVFGEIVVTRRAWTHITRVSASQRMINHKLPLLPCAREVLETAKRPYFLRRLQCVRGRPGASVKVERKYYALRGLHTSPFRADAIVEVVVEVTRFRGHKVTSLYSLSEHRRRDHKETQMGNV